jgi:2-polyprenyl-3-methyl-5-hydroxy-6-metoxy-1,4-benzoquinol methylase
LVWCSEVIEHLKDPAFTLGEINRVLKPCGSLLLTTPNSEFWLFRVLRLFGVSPDALQNQEHQQFFSYEDWPKLLGSCYLAGYFPYLFIKKTITKGLALLSPTIVVRWQRRGSSEANETLVRGPALSRTSNAYKRFSQRFSLRKLWAD